MDAANTKPPKRRKKKRPPNPVAQWLVYTVLRATICLVQALRIETCQTISRLLAVLCYDILRIRRSVIDENLEAAFDQLGETERAQLAREIEEASGIGVTQVKGDYSGDGKLALNDVISLVTLMRKRPGDKSLDYNQDGRENIIDVIVLLYDILWTL